MSPTASVARGYTVNMESRCVDVRCSLLQLCCPVLHELERLIGAFPALLCRQNREDAALSGDIVHNTHACGRENEERVRLADVQRRPPGGHRHGHKGAVTGDIEDLLVLRRPAW